MQFFFLLTADIHNGMNADAAAQLIVFTARSGLNLFCSYYTQRLAD